MPKQDQAVADGSNSFSFTKMGVSVAAVVGAVWYVGLRITYTNFYAEFGLTPEDLGLSYAHTLSVSAVAAFRTLSSGLILAVVIVGPFWLWLRFIRPAWTEARKYLKWAVVVAFGASTLVAMIGYTSQARELAEFVRNGWTIPPHAGSGGFLLPTWTELGIRAEPAWAFWTSDRSFVINQRPLTYLGEGASVTFLYDPNAGDTLVIPHDEVVVARSNEHRAVCERDTSADPVIVNCEPVE